MITVSVSDIQKNPKVLSQSTEPVTVVDKRKNINIGVFYPKSRKGISSENLAGNLGKYISEDKKNIPFEQVRGHVKDMRIQELKTQHN